MDGSRQRRRAFAWVGAVLAAAVAAAVGLGLSAGPTVSAPPCTRLTSAAYTQRVASALRSGRDTWGEQLVAASGGPTHSAAAGRLAPILYALAPKGEALTDSGVYYLPFAMPRAESGATAVMLHVADGSEIVARRTTGPSIRVAVGPQGGERYGSCLSRLTPARLAGGWLPILETRYRDASGRGYSQESFATRSGETLASYVRLSASAGTRPARLRIGGLAVAVPTDATRTLYARWSPPASPVAIDGPAYQAARAAVGAYWRERLAAGARIEVPERRVQDAQRALLVQNLVLGWRYSIGNAYEQFSFPETIDDARVLGEYGFGGVERAILLAALPRAPTPYPNWKKGEKLLGFASYYRLYRDAATLASVNETLGGFVAALERALQPNGLLERERYSSDIAERVYGLHAQASTWWGLREIAEVWGATGQRALAARARTLAARLGAGLRAAVRRSERTLSDGSVFLPMRQLDGVAAYRRVTESRAGSYWNLVAPYALASGLFPPESREAQGTLRYLDLHGARLLGLIRTAAPVFYGTEAGGTRSGVNPVYGNSAARFLADLDRPDRLVLSLYGQLAAGMTPHTFVAGEGTTVAPLDGLYHRTTYLPPNAAANATFLETLRLLLVHETAHGLDLAFATPRAWLAPGQRIAVDRVPTRFGQLSYSIEATARSLRVRVQVPSRDPPKRLRLRLRLPPGARIGAVSPRRPVDEPSQTIDLSGARGTIELDVARARSGGT
jgi:hypothetical protein